MRSTLVMFVLVSIITAGCVSLSEPPAINESAYMEGEARVYEGVSLTPISQQGNFMIKGAQYIDRDEYVLRVDGLVDNPLELTYADLLMYPSTSKTVRLNSVDGWSFDAKWTGVVLETLLDEAKTDEKATTVIFHGVDGYSTSLELDYILENEIILAYRLNDVTLPPERGFPVQVVAEGKYGYKWAKWVVLIEVMDKPYRGYWEKRGYSNEADVGGLKFGF
ncbi:oxidoreductase [Methanohalophilus halophilus]|uniref:Oxidoreductase n=2 Tax=Methanohalophilus halophilus TaxID=2177 RepID=A0A3M9L9D6_9EURY|nr:oxidoreductase [Methanohalophilus halophilus]